MTKAKTKKKTTAKAKDEEKDLSIAVCKVANYLPVDKLQIHPENPRTIKRERLDDLKRSLIKKGFYEPILVWTKDNIILAGNHRLKASLELIDEGYTFTIGNKKNQLPVVLEDCTEEEANAILFESNNHYAEWINEKLREALKDAEESGANIRDYGWTDQELAAIVDEAEKEASSIVAEHERKTGEKGDKDDKGSDEKHAAFVMPVSLHVRFTDILQSIAKQKDSEFNEETDSLVPALDDLCAYIFKYGVPDVAELD
jgi:hypothetical protein